MGLEVHLVSGGDAVAIRTHLLTRFREHARGEIGSALWIAPTRRAAEMVRERLFSKPMQGEATTLLGSTISDWCSLAETIVRTHQPSVRLLSPIAQRLRLREIIEDARRAGELNYFGSILDSRGFLESLLGFLEAVVTLGIAPDALVDAVTQASAIGTRRNAQAAAAKLYQRYRQALEQSQLLDPAMMLFHAADLCSQGNRRPFEHVRSIFVDGCVAMSKGQFQLLQALSREAKQLWIGLPLRAEPLPRPLPEAERGADPMSTSPQETSIRKAETFASRPPSPFRGGDGGGVLPLLQHWPTAETAWVADNPRPSGIGTLQQRLFRTNGEPINDSLGVSLIEAPGMVGEARMVARRIRQLLDKGTSAADILVCARRLGRGLELLHEVFDDYGIPTDREGAHSLLRNPAVAAVLRAVRLPEDDWAFEDVAAMLRSNYFRPPWEECRVDPEIARHAESLLRMLGEPRGKDAYRNAIRIWAETPPEGLEDEQAEESRRIRKHKLARSCRGFLERFFHTWDAMPHTAILGEFITWLRRLIAEMGVSEVAAKSLDDRKALARFWQELDAWMTTHPHDQPLSRSMFLHHLMTLVQTPVLGRTPRGGNRVRILSAEQAVHLEADYLFVIGLGERSFPDLAPPDSLLNDADREALREQGLRFPGSEERLPCEMSLFHRLVTMPRRELILSYPAVDEKGQALLPSTFLRAVKECFLPHSLPLESRRMLIEGYLTQEPLSIAELRVQFAAEHRGKSPFTDLWSDSRLTSALLDNLRDAAVTAQRRFHVDEFNEFDGLLKHPEILAKLQERYGPEKVFSPTALEAYAACPFRFFLDSGLHLEPLEEPTEEIEHTRRGSAFHRALARFHHRVRERATEFLPRAEIPEAVGEELLDELDRAIAEYVARAGGPAAKMLWHLEGKRLRRSAARYRGHWQQFVEPWKERRRIPLPQHLEADFGFSPNDDTPNVSVLPPLTIRQGATEIRIGGRIDRIDIAEYEDEIGFWIIDYKTGRGSNYTATDLRSFAKLQLSLYALAVERVFFADRPARPLGMAYWLVTDKGPKSVMPEQRQVHAWHADPKKWPAFREALERRVVFLVEQIRSGRFPLAPKSEHCTDTCKFGRICRISQSRGRKQNTMVEAESEGNTTAE